jgi:lysophospholipase L1-like esterase
MVLCKVPMKILVFIAAVAFVVFALDTARSYIYILKSKKLIGESKAFQKPALEAEMKILVLGDSTAVGTGVDDPKLSTAGRLSGMYPDAAVRNLAQNGLRVQDLVLLLREVAQEERFSITLIQVGANDIIRFTPMEEIEKDIDQILSRLSQQSGRVVILHSGDVGQAPLFPIYMRPLFSNRSLQMREIYKKASEKHGAEYVDLIDSQVGEFFQREPEKYYAEDRLHLSGEGYRLWFNEIIKKF